jgi:hypothetical protein
VGSSGRTARRRVALYIERGGSVVRVRGARIFALVTALGVLGLAVAVWEIRQRPLSVDAFARLLLWQSSHAVSELSAGCIGPDSRPHAEPDVPSAQCRCEVVDVVARRRLGFKVHRLELGWPEEQGQCPARGTDLASPRPAEGEAARRLVVARSRTVRSTTS